MTSPQPVQTPAPDTAAAAVEDTDPAWREALTAEVAARNSEVEQEQADRGAAAAEDDAAFGVELDALVAAMRQSGSPAYADEWRETIDRYCGEASATIAAMTTAAMLAPRRRMPVAV